MKTALSTDVLILCGGAGSRLQTVVPGKQKALAPIKGKPLLDILIDDFVRHGFRRIILAVGHYKSQVIDHVAGTYAGRHDVEIILSEEHTPLGTGGAVKNAEPFIKSDPFLVINGDSFFSGVDYCLFHNVHREKNAVVSLVAARPRKEQDYGAVALEADGRLLRFAEKSHAGGHMNAGIYYMSKQALAYMDVGAFSLERDFFPRMAAAGNCYGFMTDCMVMDIGTPERYREANKPKISVISPSFNTGHFFRETANSILNQSYTDFEYIIVDGGSTDDTINLMKEYAVKDSRIRWVSEKDRGYLDALNKGFTMARGEYIMQCAISDGYVDRDWFKKCVDILDCDSEISLVWGLIEYRSESGMRGDIVFPQFHHYNPPQKEQFIYYWLNTFIVLPEHTFVMRRTMLEDCFPKYNSEKMQTDWHQFNYNFNAHGYLPYFIRSVAAFARTHEGQAGGREPKAYKQAVADCYAARSDYRKKVITGAVKYVYRDREGNLLPYRFSRAGFVFKHYAYNAVKAGYAFTQSFFKPLALLFPPATQMRFKKLRRWWY